MTEAYREIVNEFCEVAGDDDSFALEVMKIEQLKRIADSLEGINESLGALAECVDEVPTTSYTPGYTFFRIGGGVDTGY